MPVGASDTRARRRSAQREAIVGLGLACVALAVPLAVLGDAAGPFDDPKAWALPILSALTGLGWLWQARPRAPSPPDVRTRVLRYAIVTCASWWALTTVTSVARLQSLLGTFGRGMGLLTIAATVLLFFVVQSACRTPGAVRSLVDVMLLGSAPVCLLALAEAVGWDPLPGSWDPAVATMTVRSTFGSHVFLGSYLVMLIPLTAARLQWARRARSVSAGSTASPRVEWSRLLIGAVWVVGAVTLIALASRWSPLWWGLVPWGILGAAAWTLHGDAAEETRGGALTVWLVAGLLASQVVVVVLSRARGAFLGMLVGLCLTGFALLIRHRAWKSLAAAGVGLLTLVAFLVLLNRPGSPVARLGHAPLLSRLANITNVEPSSPGWVRVQIWRGIFDGWGRQVRGEDMIPGSWPRLRSLVGYGLETQLLVLEPLTAPYLGVLSAEGKGWQARYVFDRAHNELLDHLVTAGFIGAVLWLLLIGTILAVGVSRLTTREAAEQTAVRLGALGAILGHLVDAQVGMATPMSLALFWVAAALGTAESWAPSPAPPGGSRRTTRLRVAALIGAALLAALVAWVCTRSLLASVAYATGVRQGISGQLADARRAFRQSVALAPWLPVPAESAAYTAVRLAGRESDPEKRRDLLQEAETTLATSRRYAMAATGTWALTGQIAFARAQAGERHQLAASRDAFAAALRLRRGDPRLLAQAAWVALESGDAVAARQLATQAVARDGREWVAWAVLAGALTTLGHRSEAEDAARRARELAPAAARRALDPLLP